ncbi:MAG: hypothetical protein WAN20_09725, partial [Pseudonocardiaceae bacterium]
MAEVFVDRGELRVISFAEFLDRKSLQTFSPYPECVFDGCGVTVGDVPGVSITTERRDRSLISGCPPR